ncbi:MAG: hypothetical protein DWQ05_19430 [Calditrichaeota bacterium]|nr:MAG: hypothetical protein DWQ05_19430 [Calditrichota bacterium]
MTTNDEAGDGSGSINIVKIEFQSFRSILGEGQLWLSFSFFMGNACTFLSGAIQADAVQPT